MNDADSTELSFLRSNLLYEVPVIFGEVLNRNELFRLILGRGCFSLYGLNRTRLAIGLGA